MEENRLSASIQGRTAEGGRIASILSAPDAGRALNEGA